MTFPSVYEMFDPLTKVRKLHFWDWFDADALDTNRWTLNFEVSAGSGAMVDTIDQGYRVTTDALVTRSENISFNNAVRPFDPENFFMVSKWRGLSLTQNGTSCGLTEVHNLQDHYILQSKDNEIQSGAFSLSSNDGAFSSVSSGVSGSINFKVHYLTRIPANAEYGIDKFLRVTKTNNLPSNKLQPIFRQSTSENVAKTGHINYIEVMNT